MRDVACANCGGSGRVNKGTMVGPVDPDYPWGEHGVYPCDTPEQKTARIAEWKALMLSLKPGDRVWAHQCERTVLEVGMYDGWPWWRPVPHISYIGPLGAIEYEVYYNLSR